jgi:hypothetical protein
MKSFYHQFTNLNINTNFGHDEDSSDDDDYLEIPDTIKHFVYCRGCHKVYNAKFSVFEEPDVDFLQKEHAVDVKYDCDT